MASSGSELAKPPDPIGRAMLYALSFSPFLIYAFGALFPPGEQSELVDLRPPSWLFGLAWGVLVFGLVGTCLAIVWKDGGSTTVTSVFVVLTTAYVTMACLWLVLYNGGRCGKKKEEPKENVDILKKNRKAAAAVLLIATFVAATLLVSAVVSPMRAFAFAVPLLLLLWSCFATALNTLEVRLL